MRHIFSPLFSKIKRKNIILQRITEARLDIDAIVAVGKLTFLETFENNNRPEDILAYIKTELSREEITKQVQNPYSQFYLALLKEEGEIDLAGYLKVNFSPAQTELQDANALEIERIYVIKQYQGQGIGQFLLNKAINIARQRGKKYVFLGVWEQNRSAITFYKKNKFVQFDTHVFQLSDSKQTDWLMKRKL